MCFVGGLHATGVFVPDCYLDHGGKNVDGSPEFYWGLEVRRIAREFHPTEKLVVSDKPKHKGDEETPDNTRSQDTADADVKDFEAALKEGRIKPPYPAKPKQQQIDARGLIGGTPPLFPRLDSCFADDHRCTYASHNK